MTTETTKLGDGAPKPAGTWDYYGSLDPVHYPDSLSYQGYSTFSVGVFQWVARDSGRGTKKSKAVKHFKGSIATPQVVYAAAIAFIQQQEQEP